MLYIRTDMNTRIATGHIMRCLAIADAAKELGVRSCLCYKVSDRDGMDKARESVLENAEFIRYALTQEVATSYIEDQFAFSAVKGVEQTNTTVTGVSKDIAEGRVSNFPDHYYPNGFDLSSILQQFALNYVNGMDATENIATTLATCDEQYDVANVEQ